MIVMRVFMLFLFIYSMSFAKPPSEHGTKMDDVSIVKNNDIVADPNANVDDSKLVGDDTLPKDKAPAGVQYEVGFGPDDGKEVVEGQDGRMYYINKSESLDQALQKEREKNNKNTFPDDGTPSGKNIFQEYEEISRQPDSAKKDPNFGHDLAKKTRKYIDNERKFNVRNTKKMFLDKSDPSGKSQEIVEISRRNMLDPDTSPSEAVELEQNATRYYKDSVSARDFSKSNAKFLKNSNIGALSKAYTKLDALRQQLGQKQPIFSVKCQISRGLIPGYVCPLPGKSNIVFPSANGKNLNDIRRVNLAVAKEECDDYCITDENPYDCKQEKLIQNDTWTSKTKNIQLFPFYDEQHSTIVVTNLDNRVITDHVTLKFSFKRKQNSSMTDKEWKSFLASHPKIKVNVSVYGSAEDLDDNNIIPKGAMFSIVNKMTLPIDSEEMEVDIPIGKALSQLTIKIYKPFYAGHQLYEYKYNDRKEKLAKEGEPLVLKEVKGKYSSKGVYYCIPLQTVDSPMQCNGKYKKISYGSQQERYMCMDKQHMIGNAYQGGFASLKECTRACRVHKECVPTYIRYSENYQGNGEAEWFKSEITCVDDPTNKGCTDQLCKALMIREYNEAIKNKFDHRPSNEIVVTNDDKYIYTIRNGALTDHLRPKIDLSREFSYDPSNHELKEAIKINEEKDAALRNMIKRATYNRSKYKIGEESPMNMAYIAYDKNIHNQYMSVVLKPNSSDFDTEEDFYIYSIMKVEHIYRPKYGVWNINGHDIDVRKTPVIFKDITFAAENENKKWLPFARILFAEYKSTYEQYSVKQNTNNDSKENSKVLHSSDVVWNDTPHYSIIKIQGYNKYSNQWIDIDPNEYVPYFKEGQKFTRARSYYVFEISENIHDDIKNTPGILIHSQLPKDFETDIIRVYNGQWNVAEQSRPFNYSLYLIYDRNRLTYNDVINKIAKSSDIIKSPWNVKYAYFDFLNRIKFRSGEVKDDGDIGNNIKMFMLGNPGNMSVSMEYIPNLSERGKKVYKFIFLFDEVNPLLSLDHDNPKP